MLQRQKVFCSLGTKTKTRAARRQAINSRLLNTLEKINKFFPLKTFRRSVDDVVLQRFVQRNERRRKA